MGTVAGVAAQLFGPALPASSIAAELFGPDFSAFRAAVETATGVSGLVLILVYSFLIAFILPLPSEVVLFPGYAGMGFGLPQSVDFALILLTSGIGKAAGSVFAFHIGQEAKQSGPVIRALRNSRFDVVSWSENRTVELAREYGYAGLALALCVPGFPDTISIYAFAVLERDYYRFAAATFAGSVGRLLLTMGGIGLGISVLGL
ncbi:YqaA family protein [Halostella salina]|uniref:YqaA family protein n=1 Tax=Halostella salina TaxID=1547897 RepID=UPI000EF7BF9D